VSILSKRPQHGTQSDRKKWISFGLSVIIDILHKQKLIKELAAIVNRLGSIIGLTILIS
jgi:hypothetical protein